MPPVGTPTPRIVLVSFGSAGDLYPFLGLAQAFQRLGRDVLLLCSAVHADALSRSGVPWQAVGDGEDYHRALADPDLWHPRRGIQVLLRHFGRHMQQLREVLLATLQPDEPALVLSHPFGLPALDLIRRERPRLRVAGVHLAPASLRSVGDPMVWGPMVVPRWIGPRVRQALWRFSDRHLVDRHGLPQVNPARVAQGLTPVPHFLPHLFEPADFTVTLFPPWFAPTQPDWHGPVVEGTFMLHDPHDPPEGPSELPAEVKSFLAGGSAPLVITPGSANVHASRLFSVALAAARGLGRRVVCLTPHRAQVPAELPPEVLWWPYVPLGALLPQAALLMHHGGVGTLAQALAAGVPQLVVPHGWDQFDNAVRLRRLGVARSRPVHSLYERPLRRDLQALLDDPQVRVACQAAARHLGAPAGAGTTYPSVRLIDLCQRIEVQAQAGARDLYQSVQRKTTQLQM